MRPRTILILCAAATTAAADEVVLRDGERIDGLILETDDASVLVRWGAGRAVITRRLARREIACVRLATPDVAGLRELARRSEAQGDLRDAAEVFGVVCALRPESPEDQLARARILRLAGRPEEAGSAIATATRLAPADPGVLLELGEIHLALGDARRAVRHARRVDSAAGLWLLGRACEESDMPEDAIGAYRRVLQADPAHAGALERLAGLQLSRRATFEAESAARDLIRAAPDARAGRVLLGRALYAQSRFGEAVDAFRAATALGGPGYDRARVYLLCARARSAGSDPTSGLTEAELETARELDPDLGRRKP